MQSLREKGSAIRRARNKGSNEPTENDGGSSRDGGDSTRPDRNEPESDRSRRGLRHKRPSEQSHQGSNMDDKPDSGEDIESGMKSGARLGSGRDSQPEDGIEEKPRSLRSRDRTNDEEEDKAHSGATVGTAAPKEKNQLEKEVEGGPLRVLEPLRTDPIGPLKSRLKAFERLAAEHIPEVHFIGSITHGEGMLQDPSDGCCCR